MVGAIIAAVLGVAIGVAFGVAAARRTARERLEAARVEADAVRKAARAEAAALVRAAETRAREESLELRAAAEAQESAKLEELARREERQEAAAAELDRDQQDLDGKWAAHRERKSEVQSVRDRAMSKFDAADVAVGEALAKLEARSGLLAGDVRERLQRTAVEAARAAAGNKVRAVEALVAAPEMDQEAKRLMEVASSRYENHFLTERLISNIQLKPGVADELVAGDNRLLAAIAETSNVQLLLSEDATAVRLEGLDGVGREIARRALNRLDKPKHRDAARADAAAWVGKIKRNLEREIRDLGKKAFSVLQIEPAHDDIVELVGKLNYRTSYTQNQWRHAMEASFLAGMMAGELRLDVALARRATLMHDIGKALTHEIDGSHAVIGADIARRLGEQELVANAIGAHHADEPANSIYAYLVAAADAMSGARPGARRQLTVEYGNRLEDLERIGRSYPGVLGAHAVHGGRELRVYVEEKKLNDLDVVELTSTIAARISDEMTFPGQIKVTVIRAMEAVAIAS